MIETGTRTIGLNEVMNSIRESGTLTYRDRIPELNDNNFREFAAGMSDPTAFNEWADALINRIGLVVMRTYAWRNPLEVLKKGTLEFGDTIEEIYVALIEAQKWEPITSAADAGKLFKSEIPETYAVYHKINRQDKYPVSISTVSLEKAFISPRALEDYILSIWERLFTSDQVDEYLYMKELLKVNDDKGLFKYITVPEVDGKIDLSELIINVKTTARNFTFMSKEYNAMGVDQHCPLDKQIILISTYLDSAIDVNVLASAFNMDRVQFLSRRIVVDNLGIEGALMALVSEDWYMVYDKLRVMRTLPNPDTLEEKYFYHVHQVLSTSRLENAVLFTTKKYDTPDKVELDGMTSPIEATKGQYLDLTPKVTKGGLVENVNQAVLYFLADNVADTRVNGNRLYVDLMQKESFTLRVQALHDSEVFADYKVDVVAGLNTMSVVEEQNEADVPAAKKSLDNK